MTPLYKKLKANGTSFYAFPGAAEDISAAYQNANYKMYFSKYVLLIFPIVNIQPTTAISSLDPKITAKPVYWDFDNLSETGQGFQTSQNKVSQTQTYPDRLVESLRNYVANQEVVIKESRLRTPPVDNDGQPRPGGDFFYDNTVLSTPTEKIFWKWCKKLGLISLEPATDGDEYFANLLEFEARNANDGEFLPEVLWKEREQVDYTIVKFINVSSKLKIEFESGVVTRFQIGDVIEFYDITDSVLVPSFPDGRRARVVEIEDPAGSIGQRILTDMDYNVTTTEVTAQGSVTLVYHRLVQYIGEVNGVNNVQEANRSYTEVYAHISDSTGRTPDILFRTKYDKNYKPNLTFPILPSQYQPEIMGAEVFTNPIVNSPDNYPGSYYAQFDTEDFTYETSSGDEIRRSGDYFGISGNRDDNSSIVVDPSNIDGLTLDFDTDHYVKMNIIGKEITNFDQFNGLEINNQPPEDFEFNAILWYYTVEDLDGNQDTNLYGISFVDHPDNNPIPSENGKRIPAFRKLAANSTQDGVSYAFSLNLNFNIINENPQETFNPTAINNLFSFNLFNESMRRLERANDAFLNILTTQNRLETEVSNMKQLLYSQTDFGTINKKIANLELLLRLYSNMQIVDSNTITVELDNTSRPPNLKLNNVDPSYNAVTVIRTSELYNVNGAIPYQVSVPLNKSFLLYVENNDLNEITLPNNNKLTIILDKDLAYKQYFDLIIDANSTATQNKQLEIFITYQYGDSQNPVVSKLIETIDLPVYFNNFTQLPNSAATRDRFDFEVNLNEGLFLDTNGIINVPLNSDYRLINNSVKKGDTLVLSDFLVGTLSTIDLSGQYKIDSIGVTNSYVYVDINSNKTFVNYGLSQSLPLRFNDNDDYILSSKPHFKLNKGFKYRITRVLASNLSELVNRYYVEKIEM